MSFLNAAQNAQNAQPSTGGMDPYLASLLSGGDGTSPWDNLNTQFAQPAPLPGIELPPAPQLSTDPTQFLDFMNQINGQIGGTYNYSTPQAETSLLENAPQAQTNQFGISPELQSYLSGEGFSPQTLALMKTQAREAPAQAGQQQLGQMKRLLGESGIAGPAAAAMLGDVGRNIGYQQGQNLQNVALQNANQASQNKTFGIGQQSQIGMTNMQQANQMALQNANMIFQSLRDNQTAQNQMNQFNTGNQVQQKQQQANTQSNFLSQQGQQGQTQMNANATENANKNYGNQIQQAQYDWQKQTLPWQELNQRYGQAVNTLGSWGQ